MQSPHAYDAAMSEDEFEQLESRLQSQAVPAGGMSLEMLDGYISALVVAPELVMPGEWMPAVWGDSVAADPAEAQASMSLVMAFWNHVAQRIRHPLDDDADEEDSVRVMPLLRMPEGDENADDPLAGIPDDFPLGAAWATGFVQGMALRGDAWKIWLAGEDDFLGDLAAVLALSVVNGAHAREMDLDPETVPTLETRLQTVMDLPSFLHDLNNLRLQAMPQSSRRH